MIKHALDNDAKHVVISLGGIDSFDAGAGMLQALGAQFYDDEGRVVDMRQGAGVIKYIRRMDMSNLHPENGNSKNSSNVGFFKSIIW